MKKDTKQPQENQEIKEEKQTARQQEPEGQQPVLRPEQGPDVPPQERTAGIP